MSAPRLIVVHGIHTADTDQGWMDFLVNAFNEAGWNAAKWTYGYAYALLTRVQNPGRAKKLAELIQPGDVVLGHSNGCCLAWMAAELGAPIGGAIMLNPALDCDKVMAKQVPWVNLYPNRHDDAVPFASIFVGHPWGPQGRKGISVADVRYRTTWTSAERQGAPVVHGHSGWMASDVIGAWAKVFVTQANDRLAEATWPGMKAA